MIRDGFDYWRPKVVVVVVVVSIHSYILKRFKGVWYVEFSRRRRDDDDDDSRRFCAIGGY